MATILAFEAAAGGDSGISADDVRAGRLDTYAAPLERSVASYPGEIVEFLSSFKAPIDTAALPNAMIVEEAVYEGFPGLTQNYRGVELAGPNPTLDHPYLKRPKLDKRCCCSVKPTNGDCVSAMKRDTTSTGVGRNCEGTTPLAAITHQTAKKATKPATVSTSERCNDSVSTL